MPGIFETALSARINTANLARSEKAVKIASLDREDRSLAALRAGEQDSKGSDAAVRASLRADSRLFTSSIQNVNSGITEVNRKQSGLESLKENLESQKALAEKAQSEDLGAEERADFKAELSALTTEYDRIVNELTSGESSAFSGSAEDISINISGTEFNSGDLDSLVRDLSSELETLSSSDEIFSQSGSSSAEDQIEAALSAVEGQLQVTTQSVSLLEGAVSQLEIGRNESEAAAKDDARLATAQELASSLKETISQNSVQALDAQANQDPLLVDSLLKQDKAEEENLSAE